MLSQLMWKDLQNQKGILLLGAFFLLAPYLFYFFVGANSGSPENQLANSTLMSLVLSQLTIVVMGASIVGAERQSQGMDFLLAPTSQPIQNSIEQDHHQRDSGHDHLGNLPCRL